MFEVFINYIFPVIGFSIYNIITAAAIYFALKKPKAENNTFKKSILMALLFNVGSIVLSLPLLLIKVASVVNILGIAIMILSLAFIFKKFYSVQENIVKTILRTTFYFITFLFTFVILMIILFSLANKFFGLDEFLRVRGIF